MIVSSAVQLTGTLNGQLADNPLTVLRVPLPTSHLPCLSRDITQLFICVAA